MSLTESSTPKSGQKAVFIKIERAFVLFLCYLACVIEAANRISPQETDNDRENNSVELGSYAQFLETFPLQGESLYRGLFDRHAETIQTQKANVAVANLHKIFAATFDVSAVSGFDRMSLRDLSRSTGMSMGAIYSCISKKEDLAVMVADVVRQSSELTRQHAMRVDSLWSRIEESIRFHLYASTLLQPWYFFLYFETRSLPESQQTDSTNIELNGIESFQTHIEDGVRSGDFKCQDPGMVANTIVVLLEDWYLKPWKYHSDFSASNQQQEQQLNNYYQSLIKLVKNLLSHPVNSG